MVAHAVRVCVERFDSYTSHQSVRTKNKRNPLVLICQIDTNTPLYGNAQDNLGVCSKSRLGRNKRK